MNYEATIRQLKERSQFYAAAASALEKIHEHENGGGTPPVAKRAHKKFSAESRMRMSEAQRLRHAKRRGDLPNGPNGSAGDPVSVQ